MIYSGKEDMVRMLLENAKFTPENMTEALEVGNLARSKRNCKNLEDAGATRKSRGTAFRQKH